MVRDEKGQAAILALGILTIVLVVAGSMIALGAGQRSASQVQHKRMEAYYVADAGLVKALAMLENEADPLSLLDNPGDPKWAALTGKYPEATVEGEAYGLIESLTPSSLGGGVYEIVAVGRYPDWDQNYSKKTLTAKVKVETEAGGGPGGGIEPGAADYFGRGVWAGLFEANNSTDIRSDVYCTGSITANNALRIGEEGSPGSIYANGDITFNNSCNAAGNIYSRGNIDLRNGSSVSDIIQAMGNITLGNGNKINGSVQALGNIDIVNGSNFNQLQANGTVTLGNGVKVNGIIRAVGNLSMVNGNHVYSTVWTMADLTLGNSCTVDGNAWVHGGHSTGNGSEVKGGIFYLEQMSPLELEVPVVPPVPAPDLPWYENEAQKAEGHYFDGNTTFNLNNEPWDGIYYVNGDITLTYSGGSKKYAGKATVVASGNIVIPNAKDILPLDEDNDSLLLIAGGDFLASNSNDIRAFLWAGNKVEMNNAVKVYGAVISPIIKATNANLIEQVSVPAGTPVFKILSWK
jgi:predicted acyltransferase (DUF342 family)